LKIFVGRHEMKYFSAERIVLTDPRTSHYLASEPLKLASEPADLLLFERQERTLSTIGNNNI